MDDASRNRSAFLAMLRHSEGTDLVVDPYRATFQGQLMPGVRKPMHIIIDMRDHPACTGEWAGESLAFLGAAYAHSISTAAGAYQIIKATWIAYKQRLQLPSFYPACQDAVALAIIQDHGALALVDAGNVAAACARLHGEWASLPGSCSGQPQKPLVVLLESFRLAGGGVNA